MESPDGIEWSVGNGGTFRTLYDVIQDGDRLIAVGDNVLVTRSAEGVWSLAQTVPDTEFYGAARGPGLYVAVGREAQPVLGGSIYTSPDGAAWTRVDPNTKAYLNDVAWTGERFVAAGGEPVGFGDGRGVLVTSDDGVEWVEVELPGAMSMQAVAINGRDVVVGGWRCLPLPVGSCDAGFFAALSHDAGATWSTYAFYDWTTRGLRELAWTGTEFLGVTTNLQWMSSADGEGWQIGSIEPRTARLLSIAAVGEQTVAVGDRGAIITSADRESWQAVLDGASRPSLAGVVRAGDHLVAASSSSPFAHPLRVGTSRDGLKWSWSYPQVEGRSAGLVALASNGRDLVGLHDDRIIAATEPSVWHEVFVPPSSLARLGELLWTGERFLALGFESSGYPSVSEGVLFASPDGWRWSELGRSAAIENRGVLAGREGLLLVLNPEGEVLRSSDGIAWSQVAALPRGGHLAANDDRFVAVVQTEPPGCFVSTDGSTWTKLLASPVTDPYNVKWNGTEFVMFGRDGQIATSADGATWRSDAMNIAWGLSDMTVWRFRRIAVGWAEAVLVSECEPEPRARRIVHGTR